MSKEKIQVDFISFHLLLILCSLISFSRPINSLFLLPSPLSSSNFFFIIELSEQRKQLATQVENLTSQLQAHQQQVTQLRTQLQGKASFYFFLSPPLSRLSLISRLSLSSLSCSLSFLSTLLMLSPLC